MTFSKGAQLFNGSPPPLVKPSAYPKTIGEYMLSGIPPYKITILAQLMAVSNLPTSTSFNGLYKCGPDQALAFQTYRVFVS